MPPKRSKGKQRQLSEPAETDEESSLSSLPPEEPPAKRAKKAETRQCPICKDPIPVRLLGKHAVLESERVEETIRSIGSVNPVANYDDEFEQGSSTSHSRRSALKARKSTQKTADSFLASIEKSIAAMIRHRKQRHASLRQVTRDDDDDEADTAQHRRGFITCPVCLKVVQGDQDIIDAHVDACLVGEHIRMEEEQRQEEERRREAELEVDIDDFDELGSRGRHVGNVSGTGFQIRNQDEQDVDDEIDVDGDDEAVFGAAQFTEGDIIDFVVPRPEATEPADADNEAEAQVLRDLVANGKKNKSSVVSIQEALSVKSTVAMQESDHLDLAVVTAREKGDREALLVALDSKVKQLEAMRTTLLCRICLELYTEPTASTGCWHTCCKDCWLRSLGATKLCPICKRITNVSELRRIYL